MTVVYAEGRELPLAGGRQTPGVVRVGNTVRRPTGPHSPFVHDLLRYLEAVGFEGAPKLLGVDERGREILTFVEGKVPHDHGAYSPADARLAIVASMIRRFHDATAGSLLAAGAEIVAHNELGPHNTVFVGDEPVAFIDWDDAAPGTRLFDLANAVWCFVDVGEDGGPVGEQARRIRLMCDAYGWDDPRAIVDEIRADLRRALANHERARRRKAADIFREMVRWIDAHADELKAPV
jgi:aminoglycoside phosphotransferase (APT) family kinase protein